MRFLVHVRKASDGVIQIEAEDESAARELVEGRIDNRLITTKGYDAKVNGLYIEEVDYEIMNVDLVSPEHYERES